MIRRLLCACAGAALVCVLAVPAHVVAKPPHLPENGTFTAAPEASPSPPAGEVLPMPHEVGDVTCPYLRQKMIDRQASQLADPDMGREVLDNLKRLKKAGELLEEAKELARQGLFAEAIFCCVEAADLCPGSPCAQRAVDTLVKIAFSGIVPEGTTITTTRGNSEESSEPPTCPHCPNIEVGESSDGRLNLCADYPLGANVYHLRYKHGSLSIWRTPDGGKTKP